MTYDGPFKRHMDDLAATWFDDAEKGIKDTYVYRYFDADGRLLYVGQTADPERRHKSHKSRASWFPAVARREVQGPLAKQLALCVEFAAIRLEGPSYNRHQENGYIGPGSRSWDLFSSSELDRLEAEQSGYRMAEMRHALEALSESLLLSATP